ncbi:hypothetical protein KL943_000345 [Ogataea angusta]|nr:hypothetical protein KL943_000345 [Ogataea angusta]
MTDCDALNDDLSFRIAHPETQRAEVPEQVPDKSVENTVDRISEPRRPGDVLYHKPSHVHGEIQSRHVVVHVGDAAHHDERQIVQQPASKRNQAADRELPELVRRNGQLLSLPQQQQPHRQQHKPAQTRRGKPRRERVAQQVVLGHVGPPRAHAQPHERKRPLPPERRDLVVFVHVGHERVVRRKHAVLHHEEVHQKPRIRVHVVALDDQTVVLVHLDVPQRRSVERQLCVRPAHHLALLEPPRRVRLARRGEVAAQHLVAQLERRGERMHRVVKIWAVFGGSVTFISRVQLLDDLHDPVVLRVADSLVAVPAHLPEPVGDVCVDGVRVEVGPGELVLQSDGVSVLDERAVLSLCSCRPHDKVVVRVLEPVRCHLVLLGAGRILGRVRMEQIRRLALRTDGDLRVDRQVPRIVAHVGVLHAGLVQRRERAGSGARLVQKCKVDLEKNQVHQKWQHNEAHDSVDPAFRVSVQFEVRAPELQPQLQYSVQSHQSRDKQTHPFHGAHASNGHSRDTEPADPSGRKLPVSQTVQLRQTVQRGGREKQQRRVQQNELAQRDVRQLQTAHQRDKIRGQQRIAHFFARKVANRHHQAAEPRTVPSHPRIVERNRVSAPALKIEIFNRSIKAGKILAQAAEHFAQRRMHVVVVLVLEILRAELAEMRLVPDHVGVFLQAVQSEIGPQQGEQNRPDDGLHGRQGRPDAGRLCAGLVCVHRLHGPAGDNLVR